MNYSRKKIEEILSEVFLQDQKKNLISSGLVKNIQIFGKEIELDFEIENPTLQYKKSVELKCINAIRKYYSDSEIKFNFTLVSATVFGLAFLSGSSGIWSYV